jgi:membrane-bound lytic murein transglycosylase B
MMHKIFIASLLWLTYNAYAAPSAQELQQTFVNEMEQQHSFDGVKLEQLLGQAEVRQSILDAISRPAEKRLDWGRYRRIFVTDERTRGGVAFWRENHVALERAHKEYGVPPQIIVAIIGVETRYGANTGSFPVLDALVTLGFHYPRRGKFFRSELSHFLRLAREEKLDPTKPKGSYAGAMGRPQFISSSFRRYAVDFDGDGKRDIWTNNQDVIGSVANYFAEHGWQTGQPVSFPVQGVAERHSAFIQAGYKPRFNVGELRNHGLNIPATLSDETQTSLLELKTGDEAEHWLGLDNFYVITRYNHSPLYAMAVYQLSEQIRQSYAEDTH